MKRLGFYIIILVFFSACQSVELHQVTTAEYREFVKQTDYVTDAERYGWSIVQTDIVNFEILYGIDWRCPTGRVEARPEDPVTQISYTDAAAYSQWAKQSVPDYETYWEMANKDKRPINFASNTVLPIDQVNILGNVWEITTPGKYGNIRLAGGSYLCDKNTCNGTSKTRELLVDKITGNSHIGFAVMK